jgi:hypothetical protein
MAAKPQAGPFEDWFFLSGGVAPEVHLALFGKNTHHGATEP